MLKTLIQKTWIPIVILGSLTVGLVFITNGFNMNIDSIMIIKKQTLYISGWQWNYYTIDLRQYLTNLENSFTTAPLTNESIPIIPQLPTWPTLSSDVAQFMANMILILKYIAKILITGINFIVYAMNWLFTPIKLLFYPVRIIITLLGFDTSDEGFIEIVNTIAKVQIPYIPINF